MAQADRHPGADTIDTLPPAAIPEFRERFRGALVLPDDDAYHDARQVWNGMIDKYPAIIARPTGTADVVEAIQFGRTHELPIAVRGGGHNVSGSAVCDAGIVIDLVEMDGVFVDPSKRTVRAGGGATLGDVDRETQLHGLATPLGVVSATGIAGLTLNGGMGHLRRALGLACDNLLSAEIVTADGRILHANAADHPDLLWALRGGGGNFGVVTSFEYRLHEVDEVFGLMAMHDADRTVEALETFRAWAETAPDAASVIPIYMVVPELDEYPEEIWGRHAITFAGCYLGEATEAEEVFAPLRTFAEPLVDFSEPMPYTILQTLFDEEFPDGLRYYWKGIYLDRLTDEAIELFERHGRRSPSALSTIDLWHLGGAVSDVAKAETAFWHRDKPYLFNVEANWEDPSTDDENVAWVRSTLEAVESLQSSGGGYGNFPGFLEDPARAVYGENYERLAEVKARYDPENVFQLNQNVEPAS